jgi:hypothetical protein
MKNQFYSVKLLTLVISLFSSFASIAIQSKPVFNQFINNTSERIEVMVGRTLRPQLNVIIQPYTSKKLNLPMDINSILIKSESDEGFETIRPKYQNFDILATAEKNYEGNVRRFVSTQLKVTE